MFQTDTGTWTDYLPIILLIVSAISAIVPSGLILYCLREIRSGQKDLAKVETNTALNTENIQDLEVRVQKVHDRNHDLTSDFHAMQLTMAQKGL